MSAITILPVQPDEVPALAELGRRTFEQTFASANNPADFADYLDKAFSHDQLAGELCDTESAFYFARVGSELAGYLKVNRGAAQTDRVLGRTLEIERIYVDERMQGTGVGKALFQFALGLARGAGDGAVWLGVWGENPKAIEFYKRQGFAAFGEHVFTIGTDAQRDILMRFDL
jgi:GNAT superfamily N-acetyltransferase